MNSLRASKSKPLNGRVLTPGNKSISHRAIMLGAVCVGETMISGLLESEDVLSTAEAMRRMGAKIEKGDDGLWRVFGVGLGGLHEPEKPLDMGNSGTTARLLMGLVAGQPMTTQFIGDASLSKRPMNRVMKPLKLMGARFESSENGTLPLSVHGTSDILAQDYRLPVASAQVKSAILLMGLNARGKTTVIEERPTRDHTENMLRHFGVDVKTEKLEDGAFAISVIGEQDLQPCAIDVPGDPSSAAFPAVAASITEGSDIVLPNVEMGETRSGVFLMLKEMGVDIRFENEVVQAGEKVCDLHVKGGADLKGMTVPEEVVPAMIDEFPVFAMAAACADGTTKMTGLAELRVKESDRLQLVADGLKACGVDLEMGEDSLTIHGNGKPPKGGATIATHLDHRIAMSFLVLGGVSGEPISVDDASPIQTSFPNFVQLMNELGTSLEVG